MKVLFEDEAVQQLLNDYQALIGVRIAILDNQLHEVYSSPKEMCSFCHVVRTNDTINERCRECDHKAFKEAKAVKDVYIYPCHLGLYEAIAPIYDENTILGYVMVGQMLNDVDKGKQWKRISTSLLKDTDLITEAKLTFHQLKQFTPREIYSLSRIMAACASSIWLKHIIKVERSPITDRIENYIDTHYAEAITTESLCQELRLSKTSVYNYLKSEHNQSLTKYVNRVRIAKSKHFLLTTNSPIATIASDVGFKDYNYYSRVFKQIVGETPIQYRKAHG